MSENPYAAPQTESRGPINLGQNPSPYGGYRDISSLVAVILIFLGIQAIAGIGQIVAALQMNEGLRLILEEEPAVEKIQAADSLSKGATGLRVLGLIITAIIWCIWKNKSCKNAWLFRANNRLANDFTNNPTPGWSAGSYFIPIVHLWKPFQAMCFIRDQIGDKIKAGPLLGLWWGAWIAMLIQGRLNAAIHSDAQTPMDAISHNEGLVLNSAIMIIAAIPAGMVIRQLSRGQTEKARHLGLIT